MYYENPDGVSVHDGFPNPATDAALQNLDLNRLLVWHSVSTFFMAVDGNDWQDQGIYQGDIAIIDRALNPKLIDRVVWLRDSEFRVSPLHKVPEGSEVWGVVTAIIHRFRSWT